MNQTSSSNTTAIINNTSENRHPRTTLMDNTMENVPRITSGAILFMFVSLITLLASWIYVMNKRRSQERRMIEDIRKRFTDENSISVPMTSLSSSPSSSSSSSSKNNNSDTKTLKQKE